MIQYCLKMLKITMITISIIHWVSKVQNIWEKTLEEVHFLFNQFTTFNYKYTERLIFCQYHFLIKHITFICIYFGRQTKGVFKNIAFVICYLHIF